MVIDFLNPNDLTAWDNPRLESPIRRFFLMISSISKFIPSRVNLEFWLLYLLSLEALPCCFPLDLVLADDPLNEIADDLLLVPRIFGLDLNTFLKDF